jgi:DNA-binding transcriptional MerR regulator
MSFKDKISDEERRHLENLRNLGLSPSQIDQLLAGSISSEPRSPLNSGHPEPDDLLTTIRQARKLAMETQIYRQFGLLPSEENHRQQPLDLKEILEALKEKSPNEKMSVQDLILLLGFARGNDGKSDLALKDVLPLLKGKEGITISDVVSLLDHAKPSAPVISTQPQGETFDSFVDSTMKEKFKGVMMKALDDALNPEKNKQLLGENGKVQWGPIADKIADSIQSFAEKMPKSQQAPQPQVEAEPLPAEQEIVAVPPEPPQPQNTEEQELNEQR